MERRWDLAYWSQDIVAVSAALGSGPGGLSSDKAAKLLRSVGPNSVEDASRLSTARLLLRQFESPLVLILIFGAIISLALRQWVDSAIILTIVLGSTLLGFVQEYRASNAVEQLKQRLALTCRVRRDGIERNVTVRTVVPGDLILLSAGNLIPADGLVVGGRQLSLATRFIGHRAAKNNQSQIDHIGDKVPSDPVPVIVFGGHCRTREEKQRSDQERRNGKWLWWHHFDLSKQLLQE